MSIGCPICKLTPQEVESISESEAQSLIDHLQQTQGWCFDHIFAFTDLVKRFPYEAKEWLREMVLEPKKLEA